MVTQPELNDVAGHGANRVPEVGFTLSVPTPELRGAFRTNMINYAIYGVAAITIFAVVVIATGKSGLHPDSYGQIALLFSPVTMAVVLAASWTMRMSLRTERTVQDRFFSSIRSKLNLSPMEYTDILQKPDTLILTDGETITLWNAEYSEDDITIRRVLPSEA
jgi:hypothetical protein